jgi:hypothetical protein
MDVPSMPLSRLGQISQRPGLFPSQECASTACRTSCGAGSDWRDRRWFLPHRVSREQDFYSDLLTFNIAIPVCAEYDCETLMLPHST